MPAPHKGGPLKGAAVTPEEAAEAEKFLDPKYFIESCLFLVDKDSQKVPFVFNPLQDDYYGARSALDIILKSRKMGFSSLILALLLHACATRENTRAVVVSHEGEATERLLRRVKYYIQHSLFPIRTKTMSASEISFPDTDSYLYIGTAGAKAFGRGDDITHAHLSEPAFYESLDVVTGVKEALVKNAWMVLESTANGAGTPYHDMWLRAVSGESAYKPHFYGWHEDPTNTIAGAQPFELTESLKKLQRVFDLSWEQLAWYRSKEREAADPRLVKQEHPATPEEAFLSSGAMVFDWEAVQIQEKNAAAPKWKGTLVEADDKEVRLEPDEEKGRLTVFKTPKEHGLYLITSDASLGIPGKDRSVSDVFDLHTGEQVAQWYGWMNTSDYASQVLWRLGKYFNWAVIAQENNYPGNAVNQKLLDLMYPNLWYNPKAKAAGSMEPGFKTTDASKSLMITDLQKVLRDLDVKVNSKYSIAELRTYVVHDDGTVGAQKGCNDDSVTTLMGAAYVMKRMFIAPEAAVVQTRGRFSVDSYRAFRRPAGPGASGPSIV